MRAGSAPSPCSARLTADGLDIKNVNQLISGERLMDRTATSRLAIGLPEHVSFLMKSGLFLFASGAILYVLLAAHYPAVHDTLHNFRHALAVVPCH
jgi:Probable cobalt transporter subunit (CbtB)